MTKFYDEYKKARNMAWKVLIECGITSLPVDLDKICEKYDIQLIEYSRAEKLLDMLNLRELSLRVDGFTTAMFNRKYIFYNGNSQKSRLIFTKAHELGHIFLGHISDAPITRCVSEWNGETNEIDERETLANIFASRLLAPACVLMELNVKNANDVMNFTGISYTAAKERFDRLHTLNSRNKFYYSRLEQDVYMLFYDFIKANKL